MQSIEVHASGSIAQACDAFLDDIERWVDDAVEEYGCLPASDVHDQGTYTTGWEPLLATRGCPKALDLMTDARGRIQEHFNNSGAWRHGYWKMQEVHHGTEHFELFLGTLWRVNPKDEETIRQLVDCAEHTGNWSGEVPAWFDWESGMFHSMYLGSDGPKVENDAQRNNVPDHFRCVNICLIAHQMTGEKRYLDLSIRHAEVWADTILLEGKPLPVALTADGALYDIDNQTHKSYRKFAGAAPDLNEEIGRAENFLASGVLDSFLVLWEKTGNERFQKVVERILDVLLSQLDDPDAGAVAHILRKYRRATGSTEYDSVVHNAVYKLAPEGFNEMGIEPEVKREKRDQGIGKRQDKPEWFEDGNPRTCNPILLSLAAEINNDADLAARAVDLARAHFMLARQVYSHGRRHGCSARSVSAIARGHGRENNSGMTTAVLQPCIEHFLS